MEDNPRLRFWHWFSFNSNDAGYVQIRIVDSTTWVTLPSGTFGAGSAGYNSNSRWTRGWFDLSAYAGEEVEICFYFTSSVDGWGDSYVSSGWYIDEITLETGERVFVDPEDWESGIGDWYADFGIWEVGTPTSGPSGAYEGTNCTGTILTGNYVDGPDSRLISPPFVVPGMEDNPRLRFWHWFSFNSNDAGYVQIRIVDSTTWVTLPSGTFGAGSAGYNSNSRWTRGWFDLSAYAGEEVEICFYFTSSVDGWGDSYVSSGWYIDEITLETGERVFVDPEDWESGIGDWYADFGIWEVGTPTSGPSGAYEGTNCTGTILTGNYVDGPDSRLISPPFVVPGMEDNPRLRFWHWFSFNSNDAGYVQIRVVGNTTWTTLSSGTFTGNSSSAWTYTYFPLNDYADSTVEICFRFTSSVDGWGDSYVSSGWYIDSLVVEPIIQQGPQIDCPISTLYVTTCELGQVCVPLLVHNTQDVAEANNHAIWTDNELCFDTNTEGPHTFTVIATNDYGADTCEVTVNVTQEIELSVDRTNLTFNMKEGGPLPDPKTIYIDSPCDSGTLDWDVYIFNAGNWLSVDKTSGTNPDSVVVSVTSNGLSEGIHTGLLKFIDPTASNSPIFVNVSLFVESGVDVGDYYAEKGESFKVPVNLYTLDSLQAFTIPLKNGTLQPDKVTLDSIVVDSAFRDLVDDSLDIIIDTATQTGTICLRPMQPPLPPDTINAYKVADMYYSVAPDADDETFNIDTTTVTVGAETFSYQFVKSSGESVIPAFNKGTVYIGQLDTMTIADVTSPENEPVGVPVTTTGIENIAGVQLRIGYDTLLVETYGDMVTSKYFTPTKNDTAGVVYLTWANQASPFDVPAGDTLMTLWFKAVGDSGEVASLEFLSGSKLFDNLGNEINNIVLVDGSISLIQPAFDISGNIMLCRDMTKKIDKVEIALTGAENHTDTTELNGRFYFEDLANGSFAVTPTREADENDESFDVGDVVVVQRYLADLEEFSVCQKMAADVNEDCVLSISDVVKMLRALAVIEPLPSGNWKFVDSAFTLDEWTWCAAPDHKDIAYSGAAITDASFLGFRMGDVTGDWGSVQSLPFAKGVTDVNAEVVFALAEPAVADDGLVSVPMLLSASSPVAGMALCLEYDYENLEFVGAESPALKGVVTNEYENVIYIVWADALEPVSGEQLAADLKFRLKDRAETVVSPTFVDIKAVDDKGRPMLSRGSDAGDNGGLNVIVPETFDLHQNYPNPFNPSTTIELALPFGSEYKLTIYNITGQVVREFTGNGGPGTVEIVWDGRVTSDEMAASGVYLYRVQAGSFTKTRKMLLLK
ncbi:MAG: T9SS type A sorting domain-containing protein [Candidatus Zixiibacteriota bacterium]